MPKVSGPLFSIKASGTVAKKLTFSKKSTGQQVRKFHYPKKTIKLDQWTQRHIMGLLTAHWQVMTDNEKDVFNDEVTADNLKMSGFNLFIQKAQADLLTYHGLVGYWSMNQKTGATLVDNSGSGNDGTLEPAPMANSPQYVDSMVEQYGNALSFDGIDDYVDCGGDSSLNILNDVTVEAWIKPSSVVGIQVMVAKSGGTVGTTQYELKRDGATLQFVVTDGVGEFVAEITGLVVDNWFYVAGTHKDGDVKVYLDAVEGIPDFFPGVKSVTVEKVAIGARKPSVSELFFKGLVDEVRVYNRTLLQEEITKHYNLLRLDKNRQHPGKFLE